MTRTHSGQGSTAFYRVTRIGRDLCVLGVGLVGLWAAPPSVEHFTDRTTLVGLVWAAMFVVGAACCLVGIAREEPIWEIGGCSLVGFAFVIWAIAALKQPLVTPASYQIALVFIGDFFERAYRVWMIANNRVQR